LQTPYKDKKLEYDSDSDNDDQKESNNDSKKPKEKVETKKVETKIITDYSKNKPLNSNDYVPKPKSI